MLDQIQVLFVIANIIVIIINVVVKKKEAIVEVGVMVVVHVKTNVIINTCFYVKELKLFVLFY